MKARKIRKPRNAHKKTRARKTYKNMETRKAHKARKKGIHVRSKGAKTHRHAGTCGKGTRKARSYCQ